MNSEKRIEKKKEKEEVGDGGIDNCCCSEDKRQWQLLFMGGRAVYVAATVDLGGD